MLPKIAPESLTPRKQVASRYNAVEQEVEDLQVGLKICRNSIQMPPSLLPRTKLLVEWLQIQASCRRQEKECGCCGQIQIVLGTCEALQVQKYLDEALRSAIKGVLPMFPLLELVIGGLYPAVSPCSSCFRSATSWISLKIPSST